jgi:TRAP transporter TAXI family solute receptor
LAIVWRGYDGPYGYIVRGDSAIKSIKDLKGKKIAWYSASPAWMSGAEGALRFAGLSLRDVELVRLGSYAACARAIAEGKADATYLMATSAVTFEISESPGGIRFLPMPLEDKEGWNRYHEINPLIGRGICEKGVKTALGVPMANHLFVISTYFDVEADVIYQIAKFFGEAYEEYKTKNKDLEDFSLKKMRDFLNTKCLPVHPGTVKYLKEKNLWTSEDDKWNQERINEMKLYEKTWELALKEAQTKAIKVDLNNDNWIKFWDQYTSNLPKFKMR